MNLNAAREKMHLEFEKKEQEIDLEEYNSVEPIESNEETNQVEEVPENPVTDEVDGLYEKDKEEIEQNE